MGMKKINAISLRITSHSPDVLIIILSYTRAVTDDNIIPRRLRPYDSRRHRRRRRITTYRRRRVFVVFLGEGRCVGLTKKIIIIK